ncbi:MAG: diacylglycerol kinase family protein [Flavobacteriales bacterium]|nr:diacylglycerol kinase family protein [Flavobacteriales bacterium]
MAKNYFKDRTKSFGYAFQGLAAFCKEAHARIHFAMAGLVILAGIILEVIKQDWCVLILCISAVIGIEMINSAIEKLCDVVHPDQHSGIKATKDIAAGGVLVVSIAAAIIGCIIFYPYLIN